MVVVVAHLELPATKVGELNEKTKKAHFFNKNKVILAFH
jgi:hypothetical protein